jgi:hypothetical protein
MRATTVSRLHHEAERVESSLRQALYSAGSLLFTILAILILYFGVFVMRTR